MSNVHINEFGRNFAEIVHGPQSTVHSKVNQVLMDGGLLTVDRGPSFKSLNHLNQYNYGK